MKINLYQKSIKNRNLINNTIYGGRGSSVVVSKTYKLKEKAREKARKARKDIKEKEKAEQKAIKEKERAQERAIKEQERAQEKAIKEQEQATKEKERSEEKARSDIEFEEKRIERSKELDKLNLQIKDKEEAVDKLKETGEQPATLDNIKDLQDEIEKLKDKKFEIEKPDIEKAAEERHESREDDKIKDEKIEELDKEIKDLKTEEKTKNDENAAENENLKTDSGLPLEEHEKLIQDHNKESEELKKLNNELSELKGKIIDKEFLEKFGYDLLTDKRKENNDEIKEQIKDLEVKIIDVNNKIKGIEKDLGYKTSIIDTIKDKLGYNKSFQEIAIKKEISKLESENLETQVWMDYVNQNFYNNIKSDEKKLKEYQEELKNRTDKVAENVKKIKEYENKLDELKELRKEIDIKSKSRKEIADINKETTLDKVKKTVGISVDKRDISKAEKQIEKLEKEKKKLEDENIKYEAELKEAEATIGDDKKGDDKNNEEELEKLDDEINKLNDRLNVDATTLKPSEKKKIEGDIKVLKVKKEKFQSSISKKISKMAEKIGRKTPFTSLKTPEKYKQLIEKNKKKIKEIDDKILKLKEGKPVGKGVGDILSRAFVGDVKNVMKKAEINKDSFKTKSMKESNSAAEKAKKKAEKEKADNEKLKQQIANTKKPVLDVQPKAQDKKKGPAQVYEFDYHERITKPIYYKFYPVLSLILYVMVLAILSISIINIIAFFVLYVYDIIRLIFNDDVIQYNTVTYKTVLNYLESSEADFSNENFYIFTEQYVTYKNLDFFYMGFLSLFIPFIVYGLLLIFYKMKGENYKVIGGVRFQPLVFRLLLVAVAHSVAHTYIYKYLFGSAIYLEFKKVKEQANTLDEFMKSNLNTNNVTNFYELLENGNIDVINNDINSHIESGDLNIAKKKIFTYIFYRYFTDIIEASRKEDRILLKKYLKNQKDEDHLLTFFGLLNYKKRIVKKYYTDLNFYEEYALKNKGVASLKNMLDEQIDFANKQLVNQKSYNSPYLFIAVYMLVIFIVNFLFAGVMTYLIINDKSAPEDSIFPEAFTKLILDFTNYVYYNIQYFIKSIIGFK